MRSRYKGSGRHATVQRIFQSLVPRPHPRRDLGLGTGLAHRLFASSRNNFHMPRDIDFNIANYKSIANTRGMDLSTTLCKFNVVAKSKINRCFQDIATIINYIVTVILYFLLL